MQLSNVECSVAIETSSDLVLLRIRLWNKAGKQEKKIPWTTYWIFCQQV